MKNFYMLLKKNLIIKMFMYPIIFLPTPVNINMWWNFGSMLGMFLSIQIISGFILSMHYCPNIIISFDSIIHIMKDVNSGWLIRLIHMNGASFYFMLMYIHIARNIYYLSFKLINTWMIGVTIFLLSMATAFLGYILPWGQMSFWGATVITNLLSAIPYIGQMFVEWIWGGYSINNATLNRFFSLHFIMPLIIFLLVIFHLFFLHITGSNNPIGHESNYYKISFHPYFTIKDLLGFYMILFMFMFIILYSPYEFSDPDNFKIANSLSTPAHIKPEWYFLFAYSILRSIPNKLGGVISLFMSIMILYTMPFYNKLYNYKTTNFYPINKFFYWNFINIFIMLTWLGSQLIEYPYTNINYLMTMMYFIYFMILFYINMSWDSLIYKKILNDKK